MAADTANYHSDFDHSVSSGIQVRNGICEVDVLRLAHQRAIAAFVMTDYIRMLSSERRVVAVELYEKVFGEAFVSELAGDVGGPVCEVPFQRNSAEARSQGIATTDLTATVDSTGGVLSASIAFEESSGGQGRPRPADCDGDGLQLCVSHAPPAPSITSRHASAVPLPNCASKSVMLCGALQRGAGVEGAAVSVRGGRRCGSVGESAVGESSLEVSSRRCASERPRNVFSIRRPIEVGESAAGESSLYDSSRRSAGGRLSAFPFSKSVSANKGRGGMPRRGMTSAESELERVSALEDAHGGGGAPLAVVEDDAWSRSGGGEGPPPLPSEVAAHHDGLIASVKAYTTHSAAGWAESHSLTSDSLKNNLHVLNLLPRIGSSHMLWWAVVDAALPLSSSLSREAFLLHSDEVGVRIKRLRLPDEQAVLDGAVVATVGSLIRSSGVLLETRVKCMIDILGQLHSAGADLNALVGGFTALHYVASTLTVHEGGSTDATVDNVGRLLQPLCAFLRSRGARYDVAGVYASYRPSTPEDVYQGCPRGWQLSTRSGEVEAPHPRATAMELFVDRAFTNEGWWKCASALRCADEAAPPLLSVSEVRAVERGLLNSLLRHMAAPAHMHFRGLLRAKASLHSQLFSFKGAVRLLGALGDRYLHLYCAPPQLDEPCADEDFSSALRQLEGYGCDVVCGWSRIRLALPEFVPCDVWGVVQPVAIPIPLGVKLCFKGEEAKLQRLLAGGVVGGEAAGGCLLGAVARLHDRARPQSDVVDFKVEVARNLLRVMRCVDLLLKAGARASPVLNGMAAQHLIASVGYVPDGSPRHIGHRWREAFDCLDSVLAPVVRMLALSGDDGESAIVCDSALGRAVEGCERCGDGHQSLCSQPCVGVTARHIFTQRGWARCLAALEVSKQGSGVVLHPPPLCSADDLFGVELQLASELATMEGADQWHRWRCSIERHPTMKLWSSVAIVLSSWRDSFAVEDFEVLRGREVDWSFNWGPILSVDGAFSIRNSVNRTALRSVCFDFPSPFLRSLLTLPATRPSEDALSEALAILCRGIPIQPGDLPVDKVSVLLEAGADPNWVHLKSNSAVDYIIAPPSTPTVPRLIPFPQWVAYNTSDDKRLSVVLKRLVAGGGRCDERGRPFSLSMEHRARRFGWKTAEFPGKISKCKIHDVRCPPQRSKKMVPCECERYFSLASPVEILRARGMVLCLEALGAPLVSVLDLTESLQREQKSARHKYVVMDEHRARYDIEQACKRSFLEAQLAEMAKSRPLAEIVRGD